VHKNWWLLLTIGYTLVLAVVSLINDDEFPKFDSDYDDKIFHVLAYGLLCWFWYISCRKLKTMHPLVFAAIVAIIYGIILEVLQGQLTSNRKLDLMDVVANTIGVTIVSILIVVRNKTIVKNL